MAEPLDRSTTILLVDADATGRRAIAKGLYGVCHRVIEVASADVALHERAVQAVELVVIAAETPGLDPRALCAELGEQGGPPVIVYRVGVAPDAHLQWFDVGAADYLSGDDPTLLAARCRSLIRRSTRPPPTTPPVTPSSPWHHHVGELG